MASVEVEVLIKGAVSAEAAPEKCAAGQQQRPTREAGTGEGGRGEAQAEDAAGDALAIGEVHLKVTAKPVHIRRLGERLIG